MVGYRDVAQPFTRVSFSVGSRYGEQIREESHIDPRENDERAETRDLAARETDRRCRVALRDKTQRRRKSTASLWRQRASFRQTSAWSARADSHVENAK